MGSGLLSEIKNNPWALALVIVFHIVLIVLLSINLASDEKPPMPAAQKHKIIDAVVIDATKYDEREKQKKLAAQKKIDDKKAAEKKRKQELEKKKQLEKQRLAEKKKQELDEHNITAISLDRGNPVGNPENYAESRQIQLHIEQALEKLSPRERSVFVMRHYHGMAVKEVAGILSISGGTVKSLLFRAIKKLQKELDFYQVERSASPLYQDPGMKKDGGGDKNDSFTNNRLTGNNDKPVREVYQ